MGHAIKKRSTRHYLSVGGTVAVIAVVFFLGFLVGLTVGGML